MVSTPIGAEGLPFRDGRQILLAGQPRDFASAVIEILKKSALRKAIENAARKEVVANHGWEAVVDKVEDVLDRVVSNAKKPIAKEVVSHPALVTP